MAIRITKPGQKEFHGVCKWCGCEFTYEISDLKLSATSDKLDCPTCGKTYYHSSMVQDPASRGTGIYKWPADTASTNPCAGCSWLENLLKNGTYIGDTPCTWCNKNRFSSTTGTSVLEQYINPDIKGLDSYLTSAASSTSSNIMANKEYPEKEDISLQHK